MKNDDYGAAEKVGNGVSDIQTLPFPHSKWTGSFSILGLGRISGFQWHQHSGYCGLWACPCHHCLVTSSFLLWKVSHQLPSLLPYVFWIIALPGTPTIQLFEIFLCWVQCLCFFPSFMGEFPIVFKHFLSFSQLLYCCVNDGRNKRPPITFKILCYAFLMGLLQLSKFPLQLITTSIIFFKLMFFFLSCWYIYIQGLPYVKCYWQWPYNTFLQHMKALHWTWSQP